MRLVLASALASLVGASVFAAAPPVASPAAPLCGGYPRLPIGMAPGYCAGLVWGADQAKADTPRARLPRTLLPLPDGDWLVSDLGGWGTKRGAVWRLHAPPGEPPVMRQVLTDLALPHSLALGPDGGVYIGEMNRISRFQPDAADPQSSLIPVIDNLPANTLHDDRHPLSAFIFEPDGAMLVNIGAPSDQCLDAKGQRLAPASCPEAEGDEAKGVIRRYAYLGNGRWSPSFTVLASGLRNSVALVRHPSGAILQGENSYDFPTRWTPFDEINLIQPGKAYGWPYCADRASPTAAWRGAKPCASQQSPVLLLPPHAAPLAMTYYQGAMFPQLKGRLLVSLHGYRSTGGRLIALQVDGKGVPLSTKGATYPIYGGKARAFGAGPAHTSLVLTPGWGAQPGRDQGSPVGVAVASDGAIWMADDRNAMVIRIAAD